MPDKSKNQKIIFWALIIVIFSIIFLVWFNYQAWLPSLYKIPTTDPQGSYGLFGDSFGALNTLFSGLAFAGIIISIWLQATELRETREELRGQKESLEKQNFESTFFQMLRTQNEITESIVCNTSVGRRALIVHSNELQN